MGTRITKDPALIYFFKTKGGHLPTRKKREKAAKKSIVAIFGVTGDMDIPRGFHLCLGQSPE